MEKKFTKVQAIVSVLKKCKTKQASWSHIYEAVASYYPEYATSKHWQEGIRGVVYREIRAGSTFEMRGTGVVGLKK